MNVETRAIADIRGSRWRLAGLGAAGGTMFASFWVVLSMALGTDSGLAFGAPGLPHAGPLTWPARWMRLSNLGPEALQALFILLVAILAAAWLAAIYLVRNDTSARVRTLIYCFFAAFVLLFLFAPLFQSKDVFNYIFHGRAMSVYHENPYLLVPAARRSDVFFPLIGWRYNASVYGPVFNWLSLAVVKAGGDRVAANVLGFKLLSALFFAGSLPIVHSLTRRLSPGRENMALAACAWCPLLLFHFVGGGHNDAVMAFFVLAGFLLYRRAHPALGLFMVLMAAMVKLSAGLVLLPYLALYMRDVRAKPLPRLAGAAAMLVAVPALMYLPFWEGPRIFDTLRHTGGLVSYSSVPRLFAAPLEAALVSRSWEAARAQAFSNGAMRTAFALIFVVVAAYLLSRVRDFRGMVSASAAMVFAWFLTSAYVLPWYLGLGLMLAVICGWNMLTGAYLALSSVFLLYRVPNLFTVPIAGTGSPGANVYMSLPAVILGFALVLAWMRSRRLEGVPGAAEAGAAGLSLPVAESACREPSAGTPGSHGQSRPGVADSEMEVPYDL